MKWISPRPGVYRTVPDDDPRPVCEPPAQEGIPTLITPAPWGDSEKGVHSEDAHEQRRATDQFLADRSKWTRSGKWAAWEKGRKESWAKGKGEWRKRMAEKGAI